MMSQAKTSIASSIIAVYPDHATAEPPPVRRLHEAGFAVGDLSIMGRDFQKSDMIRPRDPPRMREAGAETAQWFGGLFGIFLGAGFLILPELGLVVFAGPIAAALIAALEGGLAGAARWRDRGLHHRLEFSWNGRMRI